MERDQELAAFIRSEIIIAKLKGFEAAQIAGTARQEAEWARRDEILREKMYGKSQERRLRAARKRLPR